MQASQDAPMSFSSLMSRSSPADVEAPVPATQVLSLEAMHSAKLPADAPPADEPPATRSASRSPHRQQ